MGSSAPRRRPKIGPGSRAHLLGRYFIGLVRADRDNSAGAAEALREAYNGFSRLLPATKIEVRLVGAALGLALLRDRQWAAASDVLRPLAGRDATEGTEDETAASILHNLALAMIHHGQPTLGLTFARSAVGLRSRLNGTGHPLYFETRLVEALALVEKGSV